MLRFLVLVIVLSAARAQTAPGAACAPCHRATVESYRRTAMATSSGRTGEGPAIVVERGSFTHPATSFRYRVTPSGVEFDRNGALRGKKEFAWWIGSGATARSFVLSEGGFLFEAPVAYYTRERKWDLAPGYGSYGYPYLTRPIDPACLQCHASGLRVVAGTQNGYADPPFAEGGVACERCHGDGAAHVASGGRGAIVNPAKLAPDRRDSVCAQCHLTGEVRVRRAGKDWSTYRAGDRLADSVAVFVREGGTGVTVTSHVENLAQSACRRRSGEQMWCGTCHDPHSVPKESERVAWFRGKCMSCHEGRGCTESQAARRRAGDDCAGCHMRKGGAADAQHVVYTDHSIPRRPRAAVASKIAALVPFEGQAVSERDRALAYAIRGDRAVARPLLESAERASPDDVEVVVYLAEIYRATGESDKAAALYRRAIGLDGTQVTARVGLGAICFERGEYAEAIRLWRPALARNPGLVLTATNLAMAYWRSGDRESAEATLRNVVALSPGFAPAAELLERLRRGFE